MKVEADREVCIQAGNCVMVAENLFDQDDDGIVVVLAADAPDTMRARLEKAEELCPSQAIRLEFIEDR